MIYVLGIDSGATVFDPFFDGVVHLIIMGRRVVRLLDRAQRRFVDDLTADPYLLSILVFTAILTGFGFWHRIPEVATVDERWRLIDPMVAVGTLVADPALTSLRPAILAERQAGATLYLYGIALIPVFVAAFMRGQLTVFAGFNPRLRTMGLWQFRRTFPEWIWTWSLLLTRFVTVVIAVGCVYLTYRIGITIRDRTTGRLAAVLLSLTFGFLLLAHEVGEDIPALFCLLLVLFFALQYIKTGDETTFLVGCAVGGLAIAFKLTAATSVVLLGGAYLLRARNADWREALLRPRLLAMGLGLGGVAVVVGYPEVLVAGPDVLIERIIERTSHKSRGLGGPSAPSWWWLLRGYLTGLGLPLFVAMLGGIVVSIGRLGERSREADATVLLLAVLGVYLLVYARWAYVRVHHLLPTFPILALLLGAALSRGHDRNRSVARPLIAVLLVTGGVYPVVGDLHYASPPRDEAAEWLTTNAPDDATMEVYRMRFRDAVFPYGMRINSYDKALARSDPVYPPTRTEWMLDMPNRCPDYIQLTYWDLVYLGTTSPGQTRPSWQATDSQGFDSLWLPPQSPAPRRAEYIRGLLAGEYPYTVVAEFGPRPSLWPQPRTRTSVGDLLRAGVYPWSITYGDDQDLRAEQYTLILRRSGRCDPAGESQYSSEKHSGEQARNAHSLRPNGAGHMPERSPTPPVAHSDNASDVRPHA